MAVSAANPPSGYDDGKSYTVLFETSAQEIHFPGAEVSHISYDPPLSRGRINGVHARSREGEFLTLSQRLVRTLRELFKIENRDSLVLIDWREDVM